MTKSLQEFKLGFEEMEFKKVKKVPKKKQTIKEFATANFRNAKSKISEISNKIKHPSKKTKKLTKIEQEAKRDQRKSVIMGIGLLLVIVSIAYSTYIVRTFVDTNISWVALAPQVFFALCISIKAFSKLYK